MATVSKTPKGRRLWTNSAVVVTLLVVGAGIAVLVYNWKEKSKVAQCRINLRNCESCIAGIICTSNPPTETWRDPEAVTELMKEYLSESSLTCPDGGTYSLIYDPDNPNLPRMICSKEQSHGHGQPRN